VELCERAGVDGGSEPLPVRTRLPAQQRRRTVTAQHHQPTSTAGLRS